MIFLRIVIPLQVIVCLGTEIAVRHLRKEQAPREIILKPVVIEKGNYQPYEVPVEQRQCPALADMTK